MLNIELRSESAKVEIAGHGSGDHLRFSYFGPPQQVAFIEQLVLDAFGSTPLRARDLFDFLGTNEWIQAVFDAPEVTHGNLDGSPSNAGDDFGRLELGQKLVVSGLLREDDLNALLVDYAPFAGSQRFGEFLKLKMCLPHQVIDFMLGLSKQEVHEFNTQPLGTRLVTMGLISEEVLQQALSHQAGHADRQRLGDILVELGTVTPELAEFFSRVTINDDGVSMSFTA